MVYSYSCSLEDVVFFPGANVKCSPDGVKIDICPGFMQFELPQVWARIHVDGSPNA
jgi:hypothetical protein